MRVLTRNDVRLKSAAQDRHFAFHGAAIDELEQTKTFVVRNREHRAKGGLNPLRKQASLLLCLGGNVAENPRERVSETAGRSKAASVLNFVHPPALANFAQRQSHPAGAMVSLERHPVMPFELPA